MIGIIIELLDVDKHLIENITTIKLQNGLHIHLTLNKQQNFCPCGYSRSMRFIHSVTSKMYHHLEKSLHHFY